MSELKPCPSCKKKSASLCEFYVKCMNCGRLIDANNLQFNGRNYNKSQMKAILDFIDAQPTVYDPNKVVQQLEERTAFLKDCTKYGNRTAEQQSKSYDTMMMYEVKNLVDDLLEIVKEGGADGD